LNSSVGRASGLGRKRACSPYSARVRIETERLLLRPIEAGDLDAFAALHADPAVTRFIRPLDRDAAEQRIRLAEDEWRERGYGMVAVVER